MDLSYEVFRSLIDTDPIPHVVINELPVGVEMVDLAKDTKVVSLQDFHDDMVAEDGCVVIVSNSAQHTELQSRHPVLYFNIETKADPAAVAPDNLSCKDILHGDGSLQVLDIRRTDEVENFGKLPHSVNIPLHELLGQLNSGKHSEELTTILTTKKPVVTCCRTQRRAGFTAYLLMSIGVPNVRFVYKGACGCAEEPGSGTLCYPSYELGETVPKSCHAS
eukprot:m.138290 g.138290  ORF g.138290 m.138290 type:complete len:220 (+) comp14010_c0_seq2:694-1353(+)